MNELRQKIIDKFGRLSRFSELVNMNYYTMIKKFNSAVIDKEYFEELERLYLSVDDKVIKGRELTTELKKRIRDGVLNHPDALRDGKRSINAFAEKNPEFKASYLSIIFSNNQYSIKLISNKVKKLMYKLNIEC